MGIFCMFLEIKRVLTKEWHICDFKIMTAILSDTKGGSFIQGRFHSLRKNRYQWSHALLISFDRYLTYRGKINIINRSIQNVYKDCSSNNYWMDIAI